HCLCAIPQGWADGRPHHPEAAAADRAGAGSPAREHGARHSAPPESRKGQRPASGGRHLSSAADAGQRVAGGQGCDRLTRALGRVRQGRQGGWARGDDDRPADRHSEDSKGRATASAFFDGTGTERRRLHPALDQSRGHILSRVLRGLEASLNKAESHGPRANPSALFAYDRYNRPRIPHELERGDSSRRLSDCVDDRRGRDGRGVSRARLNARPYEGGAELSPDGRWLAYASNDSGQFQVYLRPYPGPERRVPVSTLGGSFPLWRRDGKELFYRKANKMMGVDVSVSAAELSLSTPRVLFDQRYTFET